MSRKSTTSLDIIIDRGETQKNVNNAVLQYLVAHFNKNEKYKMLDVPCGTMLFSNYLLKFFPNADITGADIKYPLNEGGKNFIQMDVSKEFLIREEERFDLITSISGIMMFGNTQSFIANCTNRLAKKGTFIITNDNSSTIKDRLSFLLLGRNRLFNLMYSDAEEVTQYVPIQEVCRLLRINGLQIKDIRYTSFYIKDILLLPLALLVYPFQFLYLLQSKTSLPTSLKWKMFPFKYLFCKHYIIFTCKDE